MTPVLRFAPSPNGELHLGHALSAGIGYRMAKAAGGRFLVRIEDIDLGRTREDHVARILDDLAWLGFTWEQPVLRQSTRFEAYQAAADRLLAAGLLYRCRATRSEIDAVIANAPNLRDPDGAPLYPAAALRGRGHAGDAPAALRIDMGQAIQAVREKLGGRPLTFQELREPNLLSGDVRTVEARPERWGDTVIVRKDTPASYHLAVVVDDAFQGVTHVTRGMDLFAATDIHRLLQVLLDLPEPVYHHHRLICGSDGLKLAKSLGSTSLASLRAAGARPEDVWARVGLGE